MGYPFNNLSFGKQDEFVRTVIEIPKNSMLKIEWNRQDEFFVLDRVEPGIFAKPANYGFIPQTLDEDGDELDTVVVTEEPLPMGLVLEEARVIGMINFVDDDENDYKIKLIPSDNRHHHHSHVEEHYEELGKNWQHQMEHHFNHYKDLKGGSTNVVGFEGPEAAWKIIKECSERALANPWW